MLERESWLVDRLQLQASEYPAIVSIVSSEDLRILPGEDKGLLRLLSKDDIRGGSESVP